MVRIDKTEIIEYPETGAQGPVRVVWRVGDREEQQRYGEVTNGMGVRLWGEGRRWQVRAETDLMRARLTVAVDGRGEMEYERRGWGELVGKYWEGGLGFVEGKLQGFNDHDILKFEWWPERFGAAWEDDGMRLAEAGVEPGEGELKLAYAGEELILPVFRNEVTQTLVMSLKRGMVARKSLVLPMSVRLMTQGIREALCEPARFGEVIQAVLPQVDVCNGKLF